MTEANPAETSQLAVEVEEEAVAKYVAESAALFEFCAGDYIQEVTR